ncbi:MAG TPA: flavodoxin, partial [Bacillota bacterium]|nr:flavodoxin [Bacillota bacterium]
AEVAELGMIGHLLIKGMLVFSNTKGGPITHYGAVAVNNGDESQQSRARFFGERVARKAFELFGKQE